MTFQDSLAVVATVAAVIAAIYAILSYHRPNGAAVHRAPGDVAPVSPAQRSRIIPIAAAIVAWGAVAFNFYDRHWSAPTNEVPLSGENARLELTPQPFWKDADKSFYMNFQIANAGKNTALQMYRFALAMSSTVNLDPDFIDAYFIVAKTKLKKTNFLGSNEFPPGSTGQFFSVPDTQPGVQFGSDENYEAAKNGKLSIFLFVYVLQRYRDASIATGKFIYTEKCVYLIGGAVHNCEQGHNRSYISD